MEIEQFIQHPSLVKGIETFILALVIIGFSKLAIILTTKKEKRVSEAPFAIKYIALFVFAFGAIIIWINDVGPILTALTIVATALTIVSKELILNFLGSFVIFWREIFAIGDRVQIGDLYGDVINKGVLYFTLLETGNTNSTGHSTGRLIKVPNALVMTVPVVNATRGAGYVWNEFQVMLTSDSNWEGAKQFMLETIEQYYEEEKINLAYAQKVFAKHGVYFNRITPRAYVDIHSGGISITLRYLSKSRFTRESQDFIVTNLLKNLKKIGAKLPQPF